MVEDVNKQKVLAHFKKTEKELNEDVEIIKNWLKTQPHLPEKPSDKLIAYYIICNKFSLEKTKTKLDMYYTLRSLIPSIFNIANPKSPQMKACFNTIGFTGFNKLDMYYTLRSLIPSIFNIANPKSPQMKACFNTIFSFNLPKKVDDVYSVSVHKYKKYIPDDFSVDWWIALGTINVEIILHESYTLGVILILDLEHLKIDHLIRVTPMQLKNSKSILEDMLSNRIKEIHFLNYPSFINMVLKLLKPVLNTKLYDRVILHETMEDLKNYIPLDILPKEYGGNEKCMEELQKDWKKKLDKYQDRFDKLDELRVDEKLRPIPLEDGEAFGIQGTFKRLNLD